MEEPEERRDPVEMGCSLQPSKRPNPAILAVEEGKWAVAEEVDATAEEVE